jgi:hypothetical protein
VIVATPAQRHAGGERVECGVCHRLVAIALVPGGDYTMVCPRCRTAVRFGTASGEPFAVVQRIR